MNENLRIFIRQWVNYLVISCGSIFSDKFPTKRMRPTKITFYFVFFLAFFINIKCNLTRIIRYLFSTVGELCIIVWFCFIKKEKKKSLGKECDRWMSYFMFSFLFLCFSFFLANHQNDKNFKLNKEFNLIKFQI